MNDSTPCVRWKLVKAIHETISASALGSIKFAQVRTSTVDSLC